MTPRTVVLATLLLSWALPAQVSVGRKVPEVEWETVFDTDPSGLAACKGKLVLLYFLNGKVAQDREEVAKLNGWYELFKNRGLLVLCVFKEGAGQLGKWVDEYKIKYPIVSGPKVFEKLGVAVTPSYYLIAGDRKVLERDWGEEPSRARIETFLARHVAPLVLPEDARFARIRAAWDAHRFGDVAAEIVAAKAAVGDDSEAKVCLDRAQESLTGQLRNVGTELELLAKGPDYWAAFQRFDEITEQYKGLSVADKAEELRRSFRSDKEISAEMKAIKELRKLQITYDPQKGDKERRKLMDKLRDFCAKYQGMAAGRLAADVLQKLY